MKNRIFKKWINRYINPHIKNLQHTDHYATEIKLDEHSVIICKSQHVIVNGFANKEGERYRTNANMRVAIMRTGELVKDIIDCHDHVLIRCKPTVMGKRLYMRLITE